MLAAPIVPLRAVVRPHRLVTHPVSGVGRRSSGKAHAAQVGNPGGAASGRGQFAPRPARSAGGPRSSRRKGRPRSPPRPDHPRSRRRSLNGAVERRVDPARSMGLAHGLGTANAVQNRRWGMLAVAPRRSCGPAARMPEAQVPPITAPAPHAAVASRGPSAVCSRRVQRSASGNRSPSPRATSAGRRASTRRRRRPRPGSRPARASGRERGGRPPSAAPSAAPGRPRRRGRGCRGPARTTCGCGRRTAAPEGLRPSAARRHVSGRGPRAGRRRRSARPDRRGPRTHGNPGDGRSRSDSTSGSRGPARRKGLIRGSLSPKLQGGSTSKWRMPPAQAASRLPCASLGAARQSLPSGTGSKPISANLGLLSPRRPRRQMPALRGARSESAGMPRSLGQGFRHRKRSRAR